MSSNDKIAAIQRSGNGNRNKYLLFLVAFFYTVSSEAQCAMCRAAIESEGDTKKAEAVNDGIVYLMAIPYILVAIIGYFIYKTGKSLKK